MTGLLSAILLVVGAVFMLLAAVGVIRFPDLFTRMHAATKVSTLGASSMLLAVAVHFGSLGVAVQALLVVLFFFLTAPVAAHMIGRAAYFVGVPLWQGSVRDDLRGRYDPRSHVLGSGAVPEGAPAWPRDDDESRRSGGSSTPGSTSGRERQ
ncbi:MAG TPA: monovalent cation/H(+) antiporter subunit G [Thermoanaerobaculia bacterium]|nr:monovalent cation/H(+) antiporter subunit G [Thermoanaerobaculia bacterium]